MRRLGIRWWHWVAGVDILLVIVTVANPHLPGGGTDVVSGVLRRLLGAGNLAAEMNLAAWWSGMSLLMASLLAHEIWSARRDRTRGAWLSLAALLAVLSFDEIGSIHERVLLELDIVQMLPPLLVGALLVIYIVVTLARTPETRQSGALIGLAFVLFGLSTTQGLLEHEIEFPGWAAGLRSGLEEGTELLGMFLCLWAVTRVRPEKGPDTLERVIPRTPFGSRLPLVLLAGLVFHLVMSVISAGLEDLEQRGNPAAWYPSTLYLIVACAVFWRLNKEDELKHRGRLALSVLFALVSAAALYETLGYSSPGSRLSTASAIIFVVQTCALALFYAGNSRRLTWEGSGVMALMVAASAGLLLVEQPALLYAVSGMVAFGLAWEYVVRAHTMSRAAGRESQVAGT